MELKMMKENCRNCNKKIITSYPVAIVEFKEDKPLWVHRFCFWKCMIEYLIENKHVRVSISC